MRSQVVPILAPAEQELKFVLEAQEAQRSYIEAVG